MANSKCMYCGSETFGGGCIYGPKGMHVHPNVGQGRCIYCNSQATGPGCVNNPYGNVHVMGVDYNSMIKEACSNGICTGYLMRKLHEEVENWPAYKLGLIDKHGHIIKHPQTITERAALTPMDIYVLKLKSIIGPEVKLLNNSIYLKETAPNLDSKTFAEHYEKELYLKDDIQKLVDGLLYKIAEAINAGFSSSQIEQIIVESFLPKS